MLVTNSVTPKCSPMVTSIVHGDVEHSAIAVRPSAEVVVAVFKAIEVVSD